jgi:hypothetical protein
MPEVLMNRSENRELGAKNPTVYEKETAFETAVRMGQGVAMKAGSTESNLLSDSRYVTFLDKQNKALLLDLDGTQIPFTFNVTVKGKERINF